MPEEPYFEVGSGAELAKKYGLTAENRPRIHLDASRVPTQFRSWIPLAERWGVGDDLIRDDCVENATPGELNQLLAFGEAYDAVMSEWLAGPESQSKAPTPEYVTFTYLGMAWDLANLRAQKGRNAF